MTPQEYIQNKKISFDTLSTFKTGVMVNTNLIEGGTPSFVFQSYGFPEYMIQEVCSSYRMEKIVIPVFDLYNTYLGTVNRTFNKFSSKYINDFKKSKHLFGLNISYPYIMKADSAYIVEGPVDCMVLFQNGIKNIVSAGGISLSEDQIYLLRRFCKKINIVFDGDERGYSESVKLKDKAISMGLRCSVICLPNGYDPDDFVNENGTEFLKEYI